MRNAVSATREDYLRAIRRLEEARGERAGVTQVAAYLHLKKSTVSERLRELERDGLVERTAYSPINLTARGRAIADKVTNKHRLIEVFLHRVLRMSRSKVHREADRFEHAMSDEVAEKLDRFLRYPRSDPHGRKIRS